MATVKLGQLISNIAGTVGNVTFRRFKNGHIAQVKTLGASKAQLLQNNALSGFADAVRYWNLVSASERSAWNSAAALHQFPDKFGDLKYLSGRQLFIKCHVNVKAVGSPQIFVSGFNTNVDSVFLETDEITLNGTNEIYPDSTANQGYCLIQAVLMKNNVIKPDYKRHEIAAWFDWGLTDHVSIGQYLLNKYPYLKVGDTVMLYATNMNPYGIRSVTEAIRATVINTVSTTCLAFNPADSEYINRSGYVNVAVNPLSFDMFISSLASDVGIYGYSNFGLSLKSDGRFSYIQSSGVEVLSPVVSVPVGVRFTLGVQISGGILSILINANIVANIAVGGYHYLNAIGKRLSIFFNGKIVNASYGSVNMPMNEGSGITTAASDGTIFNLNSTATPSDMWSTI